MNRKILKFDYKLKLVLMVNKINLYKLVKIINSSKSFDDSMKIELTY